MGEIVKVMVLDVNPEVKRISLGLKQTTENPWEALKQKYPEGSIVKGVIRNITNFGFFVGIEEGIDGLVHVSDISWKQNVKHPSELYKKGQEVEAMVLNIDVANEKFSLGIKQVDKNPWDEKNFIYAAGSVINGKVTNVTDFGIFVELEEGVEGLVHVSELSHKRVKAASEIYAVGDTVSAIVNDRPRSVNKILFIPGFLSTCFIPKRIFRWLRQYSRPSPRLPDLSCKFRRMFYILLPVCQKHGQGSLFLPQYRRKNLKFVIFRMTVLTMLP